MPGGLGGAGGRPQLPPKEKRKPGVKMKGLFWQVVKAKEFKGSLWESLDDSKADFDISKLEAAFGAKVQASDAGGGKGGKKGGDGGMGGKPKKVVLVDPKRNQNVSIALAKFRMPYPDIKRLVLTLDETQLTLDRCKSLIDNSPTAEEVDMVKSYEGDKAMLGNVEQFFLEMCSIPRLSFRLEAVAASLTFETARDDVAVKLRLVREGLNTVLASTTLPSLLEYVLAIGNHMNGESNRGGAWGFKLETLDKLDAVKSTDNKQHLVHFLVTEIETKAPRLMRLVDEFDELRGAADVSMTEIKGELTTITKSLAVVQVRREMKKIRKKRTENRRGRERKIHILI